MMTQAEPFHSSSLSLQNSETEHDSLPPLPSPPPLSSPIKKSSNFRIFSAHIHPHNSTDQRIKTFSAHSALRVTIYNNSRSPVSKNVTLNSRKKFVIFFPVTTSINLSVTSSLCCWFYNPQHHSFHQPCHPPASRFVVKEFQLRASNRSLWSCQFVMNTGMELIVYEEPAELPEFEDTVRYLAALKATLTPEHYCNFLGIMDTFRKQGFDYDWLKANVKECLEEFRYLTKCFNVFLPEPHKIEVPTPESVWIDLPTARRFLYKIKRCLTGSDQILDSFLHILQNFGENGKSVLEIYHEVAFLLQHNQYLLKEFTQFLPDILKPTANVSSSAEWKNLIQLMSLAVEETKEFPESVLTTEVLMICNKVKEQLSADDSKKFLDYLKNYSKGRLSSNDLHYLVGNLLADKPALFEEFKDSAKCLAESHNKPCRKKGKNGRFIRKGASSDDKLVKDLNLSRCFRVTPSYRLVPESYINPEASKKSEAEQQVLNYRLPCVASGNGDFRNEPSRSNPYANKLYKCEDEMYEIDMLIENGSYVIARINHLQKKFNDPGSNIKIPIRLEDHFRARNLRCITQVYGDQASEVLAALRQHPHRSLPVLLDRMNKQKQKWVKEREGRLHIWDEVMRQNYHKSLDTRSFTEKQNSKKTNEKALILAGSKELKFNDKKAALPNFTIRNKRSCIRGETSSAGRKSAKRA